jgi:hypothetical protein
MALPCRWRSRPQHQKRKLHHAVYRIRVGPDAAAIFKCQAVSAAKNRSITPTVSVIGGISLTATTIAKITITASLIATDNHVEGAEHVAGTTSPRNVFATAQKAATA